MLHLHSWYLQYSWYSCGVCFIIPNEALKQFFQVETTHPPVHCTTIRVSEPGASSEQYIYIILNLYCDNYSWQNIPPLKRLWKFSAPKAQLLITNVCVLPNFITNKKQQLTQCLLTKGATYPRTRISVATHDMVNSRPSHITLLFNTIIYV